MNRNNLNIIKIVSVTIVVICMVLSFTFAIDPVDVIKHYADIAEAKI